MIPLDAPLFLRKGHIKNMLMVLFVVLSVLVVNTAPLWVGALWRWVR